MIFVDNIKAKFLKPRNVIVYIISWFLIAKVIFDATLISNFVGPYTTSTLFSMFVTLVIMQHVLIFGITHHE